METSGGNPDPYRSSSIGGGSRRHGLQFSSNFFQSPLSAILEYSGILRARPSHQENEGLIDGRIGGVAHEHALSRGENSSVSSSGGGEVSIRIIGAAEQEHMRPGLAMGQVREVDSGESGVSESLIGGSNGAIGEGSASSSSPPSLASEENSPSGNSDGEAGNGGGNNRDSSYQRYDIQQVARWVEQVLPFSALLLVVFIRQHLQGFFVTIWIAAVMFKSNDILRKQTALKFLAQKFVPMPTNICQFSSRYGSVCIGLWWPIWKLILGERKIPFLVGITLFFMLHVVGVYWWYRNDDLLYPLIILPPKAIPPFWHAIFIIMVNDTMVRQAGMVVKSILLMYYKNSRGRNYRKQGQMLTLVEYLLLLYRALLPTPVWYRFFLNKEYGSLFSSLTTGLYLTFKLTSLVEKIQCFFSALKALSRKDVHYGSYATPEQVIAAGDLCAICQEKMHAPILLRCKHIFCEDCVSEWFERERTCPLCRALVKPADLRSFGDGSTSLFFQLF